VQKVQTVAHLLALTAETNMSNRTIEVAMRNPHCEDALIRPPELPGRRSRRTAE
jgi:hypothetical protein